MQIALLSHAAVCLSVCLLVCPRSKRKTAGAIDTKLGRSVVHDRTSVCIDPEAKGQRSRSNFIFTFCIGSMALAAWELHVDSTVSYSSFMFILSHNTSIMSLDLLELYILLVQGWVF